MCVLCVCVCRSGILSFPGQDSNIRTCLEVVHHWSAPTLRRPEASGQYLLAHSGYCEGSCLTGCGSCCSCLACSAPSSHVSQELRKCQPSSISQGHSALLISVIVKHHYQLKVGAQLVKTSFLEEGQNLVSALGWRSCFCDRLLALPQLSLLRRKAQGLQKQMKMMKMTKRTKKKKGKGTGSSFLSSCISWRRTQKWLASTLRASHLSKLSSFTTSHKV